MGKFRAVLLRLTQPAIVAVLALFALGSCFLVAACGRTVPATGDASPDGDVPPDSDGPGSVGGSSSFDLIEKARVSGALDRETAIEYKAFALFKEARLLAIYRGDDTDVIESDTLDEIYDEWATLSPAAQQILEPFLIPPAYLGSWASPAGVRAKPFFDSLRPCYQPELDPSWASVPASNDGRVKVWFDTRVAGQATLASTVLTAVENEIWPRLVDGLGMRAPLPDATNEGCNGGDGRLDIYLVDMASHGQAAGDYGATLPVDYAWTHRPVFILLNHNLPDKQIKGTAAHEFMHASQWAYPVAGIKLSTTYAWLKESTAQWAIDYVYPTQIGNFEQGKAPAYENKPNEPLNALDVGQDHVYGSYLFFQFLARTQRPGLIKDIWDKTISESDEVKAVDTVIPGGFKEQWPKFAKLLWNQAPVNDNSFEAWDNLMTTPALGRTTPALGGGGEVKLNGLPSASYALNGNIKHLAIKYYHFVFADANIRSVTFFNHVLAVTPVEPYPVSVQAFYKKAGSDWEWEHWSDDGMKELTKPFCLDVIEERLVELVVVMSNDNLTNDIKDLTLNPRLAISNVGCWRYQGTSSVTQHISSQSTGTSGDITADSTVMFERMPPDPSLPVIGVNVVFQVHDGSASGRSNSLLLGGLFTTHMATAGPIAMADGSLRVDLGLDLLGIGSPSRNVYMRGDSSLPTMWTRVGPDGTVTGTDNIGWRWLTDPAGETAVVKPDGTIQGSNTETWTGDPAGTKTTLWAFTPLRQ